MIQIFVFVIIQVICLFCSYYELLSFLNNLDFLIKYM